MVQRRFASCNASKTNSLRTFRRNEVSGRTNEDNRDFLESVQSFRGVVFYNNQKLSGEK